MVGGCTQSTRMVEIPRSRAKSELRLNSNMYLLWSSVLMSFSPQRLAAMPLNPRPRSSICAASSRRCDFSGMAPGQSASAPAGLPGLGWGGERSQLQPVEAKRLQLVTDHVEWNWMIGVWANRVGPRANGNAFGHGVTL